MRCKAWGVSVRREREAWARGVMVDLRNVRLILQTRDVVFGRLIEVQSLNENGQVCMYSCRPVLPSQCEDRYVLIFSSGSCIAFGLRCDPGFLVVSVVVVVPSQVIVEAFVGRPEDLACLFRDS